MAKAETQISDSIREFLESKGFKVFRMQSGRFRGAGGWVTMNEKGCPDLICLAPGGRLVAIETKTPEGHASKEQIKFKDEINAMGGFAMIAHSLGEVVQALDITSLVEQ